MAKAKETPVIEIQSITTDRIRCHILGASPLIMHRFSKKAQGELLMPRAKLNAAEKATHLKHDPIAEFRETIYQNRDSGEPTQVHFPADAFSKALAAAALDIPGASKSQMTRLTTVASTQINIYGIPEVFTKMVRSSDMARTPDVRTRSIFKEWACTIDIQYVSSLIKAGHVVNLLAAAGTIIGIGDWRPQKGGSHGKFQVVPEKDADFLRILKTGNRAAQIKAIESPSYFDAETEELLTWFHQAAAARERVVPSVAPAKTAKTRVKRQYEDRVSA